MTEELLLSTINDNIFAVWFLAGAALVFWMQAGFAMVETGFTRAKNAGNILIDKFLRAVFVVCRFENLVVVV